MAKVLPAWKSSRRAALMVWRETLSRDDREAMDSASSRAKANAAARRESADERMRQIVALALHGHSTEEIAKSIKTARSTVRGRLARLGIEGAATGMRRAPAAFIPAATRAAIEALAADRVLAVVKAWIASGCEGPRPNPDAEARRVLAERLCEMLGAPG